MFEEMAIVVYVWRNHYCEVLSEENNIVVCVWWNDYCGLWLKKIMLWNITEDRF